jgi:hypothetical protein
MRGGKPQHRLKASFDINAAKYKDGRAGVWGSKNQTIWNPKPNSLVALSEVNSLAAGNSSNK